MELRFFMIVFFFDIDTAPLERHAVTIMGSISGVSPTATARPNSREPIQSLVEMPFARKTIGTMVSIKRINTHETAFTPFSKLVWTA